MNKLFSHKGLLIERGGSTSSKVGWVVVFILLFVISYSLFVLPAHASRMGISKPGNNLGLVGWWTMDGADMNPNVRDRSGNDRHGNLTGQTSTTTVPGRIGQALNFDGNDDIITTGSDFVGTSNVTVTAWIKLRSYGGTNLGQIITNESFMFRVRGGGSNQLDYRANNNTASATDVNSILLNQWYFVTLTRAGTTANFYIDGIQSGTPNQTNEAPVAGSTVKIGNRSGNDLGFDGLIDDLRVYNRVLSVTEVKAQYNSGSAKFTTPNDRKSSLENGLVGHWTFDGKDMPLGRVLDVSGKGNHASVTNMATSTMYVTGKLGQALKFNGTNSYIDIDSVASFVASGAFSVSSWINPSAPIDSNSNERMIFRLGDGPSSNDIFLCFGGSGGTDSCKTASGATAGSICIGEQDASINWACSSQTKWNANTWYHVVGTFNPVSGTTLYINGTASTTNSNLTRGVVAATHATIGARSSGAVDFFNGPIDDMRVYNRVLSATEVKSLYNLGGEKIAGTVNSGKPALNSGLVGHWTFDGKDMPLGRVLDVSGSGNHGSAVNMSTSTMYAQGKVGQALKFDGVNDSVILTSDPVTVNTNTMCAWVNIKPIASSGFEAILGKEAGILFMINNNSGTYLAVLSNDGGGTAVASAGISNPIGWHHVCAIRTSAATNNTTFYIDGLLSGTPSQSGGTPSTGVGSSTNIGDRNTGGYSFNGTIDDVRVYNRSLSASEILGLYNMGK